MLLISLYMYSVVFFFKQKTAYEMRISDWSSDVCSSDLDRGQSGENRAGEAAHRPGLRQEPAEQAVRGRQLVADDRGAQRDRVRLVDHLAPALAGAVEVESIGRILLAIVTARAVEDAVGTDVDEPRTGDAAQSRSAMREQRVDRYRVEHAPRDRKSPRLNSSH